MKALYRKEPRIEIINMLKNVGFAYSEWSFSRLSYYKKALEMYRALYGDRAHVDIANMLSSIGRAHHDLGDKQKALLYAKESLAMFMALYGDSPNLDVATALFNVGACYQAASDFDNALSHYQQSLKMYTALADSELYENLADVLNNMGLVHFKQKDFRQALTYFKQASEVYKSRDEGHVYLGQAKAIQNIGATYIQLKDFIEAIPYFKEAVDIYKKLSNTQHDSDIMSCFSNIGYAYEVLNNLSESLAYYEQALKISEKLYDVDGASYESGNFIEKIARVHGYMNNFALKLSYLQKANYVYRRLGNQNAKQMSYGSTTYRFVTNENVARVLFDIGMTYSFLGDLQQSSEYFSYASKDYKILYNENKNAKELLERQIISLRMMGMIYASLGKYRKAEKNYRKSLKMAYLLKAPYYQAYAHYSLGRFYHWVIRGGCSEKTRQRYINKAQAAFESTVQASNELKRDLWTSYADFLIDTGQLAQAYDCLIRATVMEDHTSSLLYIRGDKPTVPIILQELVQQEKVVIVRAIDYAFYLLIHHYDAFLRAGITPEKSREAYLAAYKQSIEARTGGHQVRKEKEDKVAKLLLDKL